MDHNRQEKTVILAQAMEKLTGVCSDLERSQSRLNAQIEVLNAEMERKQKITDALFANLPMGVIIAGANGEITYFNSLALKFIGAEVSVKPERLHNLLENKLADRITAQKGDMMKLDLPVEGGGMIRISSVPLSNPGEAGERLLLIEDVTDEKRQNDIAERKSRLVSLGETAAAVAHEIRNPLGSMELFLSMLAKRLEEDGESLRMIAHVRSGLANIERSVSNLLLFASPIHPHPAEFDLSSLIRELADFCVPIAEPAAIDIKTDVPDNMKLFSDKQMFRQLYLNLVMNAVQAMPDGGKLSISARKKGGNVLIEFRDTGCGIPAENMRRIFDPFFTTRENGTGLGLAITHNMVTVLGGTISAESASGNGTVFKIEVKERLA